MWPTSRSALKNRYLQKSLEKIWSTLIISYLWVCDHWKWNIPHLQEQFFCWHRAWFGFFLVAATPLYCFFWSPNAKTTQLALFQKKTILHRENRAELFLERPWTTSLGNNQRKHWFRSFWTPVSFWLHCPKQTAVSLMFSLGSSSQLDCKTLFLDSVDSCLSKAKILCRHFDSLNGYDVKILNTKFCQILPWPKNQILQCLSKKQNNDATPTGLLFHKALMWTQEQENKSLSLNNDIYTTFHVATKSKPSPEVKPECMGDAWCFFIFILGWHVSKYAKYKLCYI